MTKLHRNLILGIGKLVPDWIFSTQDLFGHPHYIFTKFHSEILQFDPTKVCLKSHHHQSIRLYSRNFFQNETIHSKLASAGPYLGLTKTCPFYLIPG